MAVLGDAAPLTMNVDEERATKSSTPIALVVAAWLFVGAPLLWGVLQTLKKAAALFQ